MCEFFSGIQTKKGILFDPFNDSHERLIRKYRLNDKTREPEFVRLELIPRAEPWNKDPNKWVLHVDQDILPSWFSEESAKQEMWAALQAVWADALILDEEVIELKDRKIRWIVNSRIKKLSGRCHVSDVNNSTIEEMRDFSSADRLMGDSIAGVLREHSKIYVISGQSQIGELRDLSQVGIMRDFSRIGVMKESSLVKEMCHHSRVDTMEGYSMVLEIRDKAKVGE